MHDESGKEKGLPNITSLLSKPELISMLKKVGFSNTKEISLRSEKEFDVIIAKK